MCEPVKAVKVDLRRPLFMEGLGRGLGGVAVYVSQVLRITRRNSAMLNKADMHRRGSIGLLLAKNGRLSRQLTSGMRCYSCAQSQIW